MRRQVGLRIEAAFSEVSLTGSLLIAFAAITMALRECAGREKRKREKKMK